MTTTDYLINGAFAALVLKQAFVSRRLDRRAFLFPLIAVFFVAQIYLRTIPATGNDLVFIAALAAVGTALGLAAGVATDVRRGDDGHLVARVGWLAGSLLLFGICSRMGFSFAVSHGAGPAVRGFSIAHQIGASAWPVAFVGMAVCEVVTRIATVAARSRMVCAG
jgi:hypothetical protein